MMARYRQPRSVNVAALPVIIFFLPFVHCQAQDTSSSNDALLKQHYEAAQNSQSAGNLEEAAHQYRLFVADALGQLALDRAHAGQYERAAPLFEEALYLAPRSPILQIEYARAALAHGDLTRSKTLANQVLSGYPNNAKASAKAHLILGRAFLRANKDQEARQQLEAAVALEPDFEDGYALALACLDMGDQTAAARIFSEMESALGSSAIIHREFGRAYAHSDFPQKAIPELEAAIAKDHRLTEAHYLLAAVYLAVGGEASSQAAERELHNELEVSPKESLAYTALGQIALGRHQYAQAEKDLRHAIALQPESVDAYFNLGELYLHTSRASEAEAALRKSIALTTDVSYNRYQVQNAHYLLGRLLVKSGRGEDGRKELQISSALLQQSLQQDRNRLSDYLRVQGPTADALMRDPTGSSGAPAPARQGPEFTNTEEQIDDFEKKIGPAVADGYNNLGVAAAINKDFPTALSYFQKAAEWNSSLPGLDYNWGKAAYSAGQYQQAVSQLSRYLQSHPADTNIRSMLGVSRFLMNDYAGTLSTLRPIESQLDSMPQVACVYAASMVRTGEVDHGIERLVALEQAHPDLTDVHHELAAAYAETSRPQEAMREIQQYETLRSESTAQQDPGKPE
jgi:tetratricopeptide (TPR) repeat protein